MDNKQLRALLMPRFGLYLLGMLSFAVATLLFSVQAFLIEVIICVLLYVFYLITGAARKKEVEKYIDNITTQVSTVTTNAIADFPIPVMISTMKQGQILWHNDKFSEILEEEEGIFHKEVKKILPGFDTNWVIEGKSTYPTEIKIGEKYYTVYGNVEKTYEQNETLIILYFLDTTEKIQTFDLFVKTRPIVSIIAIDNFEELLKNGNDSAASSLLAEIDKKISEWVKGANGIIRKYDRDKYIFIFEEQEIAKFIESKFSVLDEVRTIMNTEGINATLSIGIGKDGESLEEKHKFAALALDMSLSRGGDQAVIKNKYTFEFFGGHSKEVEKRTKVKSRVMANSLKQLIKDSSKVYIMGHKVSDIDSVGSAVGLVSAVRDFGKEARIVIDRSKTLATPMLQKLYAINEYKDVFMNPQDAMLEADSGTLLIIVDTNRPDFVESPELLESCNKVAVIDHHRRAASYIENCAVNFHEPYASSASELVAELLQYMIESRKLMRAEAECLLAGIFLDTKGFTIKAGVRTFEAAAYLKRAGADMIEVKKLFQNSFDAYMQKQRIISCAKHVEDNIVVAVADFEVARDSAAQAADEMLSISGISATFVVFINNIDVVISARSLGDVNCQVITEKLNGGGSLTAAGAQIENGDIYEIEAKLEKAIKEYLEHENKKGE